MSKQPAVENYMDRFEWSKRDIVSYVRDLVELFGGVEKFAKGLLCRKQSVEQVLRGDAPPEYVIFHLGIRFDSKSGKYYRIAPPEIYQIADGVMPLHPHEWLELITLRIEVERMKERAAQSSDANLASDHERQRRELVCSKQEVDRLSRENARLKRERFEAQSASEATKAVQESQRGDDVALCQEEIRAYGTYAEVAAKYRLSRLTVLNMANNRIRSPRSKWAPVIEAALKRRAEEARDAA